MPIPTGARQVPGSPNRVRLGNGEVVTRARALTMGAQDMGYRSNLQYRGRSRGDKKYYDSWVRTSQGQAALQRERQIARSEGRKFKETELKQRLIAARNQRPTSRGRLPGSPSSPAGPAYQSFMDRYDMEDREDWVDY
jgi:hypothetical protein